jgi:hypothetical protein
MLIDPNFGNDLRGDSLADKLGPIVIKDVLPRFRDRLRLFDGRSQIRIGKCIDEHTHVRNRSLAGWIQLDERDNQSHYII